MSYSRSFVVVAAMLALTSGAANASELYDNLFSVVNGADQLQAGLADSFSTGNSHFEVSYVALRLRATNPGDGGVFKLELLSDKGKLPGKVLTTIFTIPDSALKTSLDEYDLPFAPYVLAPHTRYWIGAVNTSDTPVSMEWAWSDDQTALGVAGEYYAPNGFDHAYPNLGGPYMLEVSGSEVPEPMTLTLFAAGLAGWRLRRRRKSGT
ncbi:choice-of-anchor R domain-containing protein [Rhizomicrobium electricum]|uniref:Ice-binding protein C-terminal domain-containing protein n=1 Tax=Rhizomicrobium electricum TaxID=480070 RepID=A0ABP3PBN6_9PROT|nr:choice-of-anchor R domain-containing protein [Rhizomicrobium electricum]NIJ47800.1 hypothetical protein [Rhizomicrobium electricum]